MSGKQKQGFNHSAFWFWKRWLRCNRLGSSREAPIQRVLMMAGGTGGHIFPALSVAHALQARGIAVEWLGTDRGMERILLANEAIHLHVLSVEGFHALGMKGIGRRIWKLIKALVQSIKIIHAFQPDVVFGMGGYVSGPGGLAAWLLRKRLIIHEQNAVLGMANRWLSPLASDVLLGFKKTMDAKKQLVKGTYVGNPLREAIVGVEPPQERWKDRSDSLRVLVFAGSQGSPVFNSVVPKALQLLSSNMPVTVWHQAGEKGIQEVGALYREASVLARVQSFIVEMAEAYRWADIVIARSGALTVSEVSCVGLPAIFVPYPHHTDEQQKRNAEALVECGAALCIDQSEWTPQRLASVIQSIGSDRKQLLDRAVRAYALREPNAVQKIVALILGSDKMAS